MAWGDPGKSTKLRLTNNTLPFSAGGTPVNMPIQQSGILEKLRLRVTGTNTVTLGGGTAVLDTMAPGNLFTNININSNNSGTYVLQASGLGVYHINLFRSAEKMGNTPDTVIVLPAQTDPLSDVYAFPLVTGPMNYALELPIVQNIRSLGGKIGYWLLQNPAVALNCNLTPNVTGSATPFNIYSLTAGTQPYLTTGAATVTLTSPTFELHRELWEVPADAKDYPPFQFVSTWLEDSPQGVNVNGASKFQHLVPPLSGLLTRYGVYIYDGATNQGVSAAKMTGANALLLTTDNDTPKFSESAYIAYARQAEFYGFQLPYGLFVHDLLGSDLTLQDTLDTGAVANIKLTINLSSALGGTNSLAKIYMQRIQAMQVQTGR